MANYFITGVSSGIGRELTKKLINDGHSVFGVARRKNLLQSLKYELNNSNRFSYLSVDISKVGSWKKIQKKINKLSYKLGIVIFNAAIFEKDYQNINLDISKTRRIFEINFFSIITGFEEIIKSAKKNTQFIFISSSSALKGSGAEGVGYPASKAALSSAFESLYLKYKDKFILKIIYFGPINTDMLPSKSRYTPVLSKIKAVEKIEKTIKSTNRINYAPGYLFFILRLIKIFPEKIYLTILSLIDILHLDSIKKNKC